MSEGLDTGQPDPRVAALNTDYARQGRGHDPSTARDASVGDILSGLIQDLQELIRGEVRLAKTELRDDAMVAARGLAAITAGALIGMTGFIFLMLGVTYLLNKEIEMWQAAGIVGLALTAIAAICILVGKSRLSAGNFTPEQTIDSLKENREWAKQQINSVKK